MAQHIAAEQAVGVAEIRGGDGKAQAAARSILEQRHVARAGPGQVDIGEAFEPTACPAHRRCYPPVRPQSQAQCGFVGDD